MVKKLLLITFMSTLMFVAPAIANTAEGELNAQEQTTERNIDIDVDHSGLHISGASGLTLEVVSLTGRRVATVKIDSPSQRIELNIPKGCYILKIGKVVRKVSIR